MDRIGLIEERKITRAHGELRLETLTGQNQCTP
jgi:hypothetical protein